MIDELKELGPVGAFITMMGTAVTALAAAVGIQWRQANTVYGLRLKERDTLNEALTKSAVANDRLAKSIEERNRVTEELADAIGKLAAAWERVNDRIEFQHTAMNQNLRDQNEVIKSLSDALRVNTGMLTEVRNLALNSRSR